MFLLSWVRQRFYNGRTAPPEGRAAAVLVLFCAVCRADQAVTQAMAVTGHQVVRFIVVYTVTTAFHSERLA